MWTEYVLVTRIAAYLDCCSLHVCISELFANLVDCDGSPALSLNGKIFQILGSRIFSKTP